MTEILHYTTEILEMLICIIGWMYATYLSEKLHNAGNINAESISIDNEEDAKKAMDLIRQLKEIGKKEAEK